MKYTKKIVIDGKSKSVPYKFPSKREERMYIDICETIWGCVPIEIDWAIQTKPYKRQEDILKK